MHSALLETFSNGFATPVDEVDGEEFPTIVEAKPWLGWFTLVYFIVYFGFPTFLYIGIVIFGKKREKELKNAFRLSLAGSTQCPDDSGDGKLSRTGTEVYPVLLTFRQVEYEVKNSSGPGTVQLLRGVDGYFLPGTMTAIMGPSGCGKSTLLDVLSNRKTTGTVRADVRVNGKAIDWQRFKQVVGFVQQSDCLLPRLTVRETLSYSASFRLPSSYSMQRKAEEVEYVIDALGLSHVADNRIGDGSGGLSGGQKRRVTVGIEMVANPSILFLDEPTSGLDAYGSLQVIQVLRKLADKGHTLALTIHQPRADIFNMFDNLLLMKKGEVMYFGAIKEIIPYFGSVGFEADEKQNPAEFVVDLTHHKEDSAEDASKSANGQGSQTDFQSPQENENQLSVGVSFDEMCSPGDNMQSGDYVPGSSDKSHVLVDIAQAFKNSASYTAVKENLHEVEAGRWPNLGPSLDERYSGQISRYHTSFFSQVFVLTHRALTNDLRSAAYISSFILGGVTYLFYGTLYVNVPSPESTDDSDIRDQVTAWQSRSGIIYQTLAAMIFAEQSMVSQVFFEKALFNREHFSGTYGSDAFHFAWYIRLIMISFVKGVLYTPLFYFLSSFLLEAEAYFLYTAILCLCSAVGSAMALLCASAAESFRLAAATFTLLGALANAVSGYFLTPGLIPPWFIWLYYLNYVKYALEGSYINQFEGANVSGEVGGRPISQPVLGTVVLVNGYFNRYTNPLMLSVFPIVLHLVAWVSSVLRLRTNDLVYINTAKN